MNEEQWRQLKFDRLNRVNGVVDTKLKNKTVGVFIEEENFSHYSNQVMVIVAINILAKWCNKIILDVPENAKFSHTHYKGELLTSLLAKIIKQNDQYTKFEFNSLRQQKLDIILSIGKGNSISKVPIIYVESNGWLAGCGKNIYESIEKTADLNPIGAAFSACLGNAALFRELLGFENQETFWTWHDLFSNQKLLNLKNWKDPGFINQLNLGKVLQVGCGAVGSSFAFLLTLTPVAGILTLIDFDRVKIENLISSIAFLDYDARNEVLKIDACEKILKQSNLTVEKHEGDYSSFIKKGSYLNDYPDLILCLANEKNIWSTIQHNYPPLVFHATTSATWGLNVGRHIPLHDGCIVCRFGIQRTGATPICGNSIIEADSDKEEVRLGVLPFLSPASAVLLLSEMFKMQVTKSNPKSNFTEFSMKVSNSARFINSFRQRKIDCPVCSNQDQEEYKRYFSKSKYLNGLNLLG